MAEQMPIMPFFVRDYIAATRHMTLEQRGAYTDLLFFQWDLGKLPSDPIELARMLGASVEHFSSIWPSIADKFEVCDASLKNSRVEIERKKSKKLKKSNIAKAKNAAKVRWHKEKKKSSKTMHQALLEECPPSPSASSSESESESDPRAALQPNDFRSQLFRLGASILGHNGRSLIGKALKNNTEEQIGAILGQMALKPKADAPAYFIAALKNPAERQAESRRMIP